ncbi:MAG: NAD-dependent epimerase/dehydratase family protein [Nitrospirae bacterium]|nr:MAG: NAD-dependent epimerase/dehydratase family protein [Nitrospirota bacterium]
MASEEKRIIEQKKSALVTGASGFIGRYLVQGLLADGMKVYALTRSVSKSETLKGTTIVTGDITEGVAIPEDVSTVYHCAGVIYNEGLMERVNVIGTEKVATAAQNKGCRLIHLSSAGVVGNSGDANIDEQSPCSPQNRYERTKHEAENILNRAAGSGLRVQMLRPTIVFGMGRAPEKDSFLQLIRAIKSGRYRHIGKGQGIYNIIHANEVARAMKALDDDNLANCGTYLINNPLTFDEFAKIALDETAGLKTSVKSIPYAAALPAALLFSAASLITGKKMPLTLSRLKALTDRRIFSQRILLGKTTYSPERSVEEYLRQTCREYRERGLLV